MCMSYGEERGGGRTQVKVLTLSKVGSVQPILLCVSHWSKE